METRRGRVEVTRCPATEGSKFLTMGLHHVRPYECRTTQPQTLLHTHSNCTRLTGRVLVVDLADALEIHV